MNVYLTFDIEVWCNGWARLDENFPGSFERYVYGASREGGYALPKTLEILQRHGLRGVFFVEPLFSARFGSEHLKTITDLILAAGQDVQLHLHPEWTDEIRPGIIDDCQRKRQHLTYYTLQEQTALIAFGKTRLEAATGLPVTAFRAGSFAANRDTFSALAHNGIFIDSSLNESFDHSQGTLPTPNRWTPQVHIDGVECYPVTVFSDGFGSPRAAQVGSCSFAELRDALLSAEASGCPNFVLVSHNFEMLRPGSTAPDYIVAGRFEKLCGFLGRHAGRFEVGSFAASQTTHRPATSGDRRPGASALATTWRHAEQLARRAF